jgi:hypothetical protein
MSVRSLSDVRKWITVQSNFVVPNHIIDAAYFMRMKKTMISPDSNIYSKLGVGSRTQAVASAREFGLL